MRPRWRRPPIPFTVSFNVATVGTEKTAFFDGEGIQYARTPVAANDGEAMTLKVASIVEVDSAGDAVGALAGNFVDNVRAAGDLVACIALSIFYR